MLFSKADKRQHCKRNGNDDGRCEDDAFKAATGLICTAFRAAAKGAGKARRALLQQNKNDENDRKDDLCDRSIIHNNGEWLMEQATRGDANVFNRNMFCGPPCL